MLQKANFVSDVTTRVEIAFHLAGESEDFNALISMETEVKSHWRWFSFTDAEAVIADCHREIGQMVSLPNDVMANGKLLKDPLH